MIIRKLKYKVSKNGRDGKWRKGSISLPADISEQLKWENQDVIVVIATPSKELDSFKVKKSLEKYSKLVDMEKEINKMKDEMVGEYDEDTEVPVSEDDTSKFDEDN